jgi:SAM-dependent methyltransferase
MTEDFDWDKFYREGNPYIPDQPPEHSKNIAKCVSRFIELSESEVLDVGCGTCIIASGFISYGARVVGLDSSLTAVNIAKNIISEAYFGTAESLPFENNRFDVVMSSGLMEHFQDEELEQIIDEQLRVLKEDGLLLVMVPNPEDIIYRISKHSQQIAGTWQFGTERDVNLTELARYCGIKIVHIDAFNIRHTRALAENIGFPTELIDQSINTGNCGGMGYLKLGIFCRLGVDIQERESGAEVSISKETGDEPI